ncbi:hypothetical protein HPB50_025239 [Hyalomma asiaticum]|uniref:Uncharacterized protein n=1 Tax=Hyalomma asiaticum TaxID=266040 RepID=A0ACB7SIX9_HYAAI|nr:hypothetical protein HPB50_025239 [Hyalomma asiaticum]
MRLSGNIADCTRPRVDLVLNSLAEDKLQASVRCLTAHGRFLEMGKMDMANDSPLKMSVFLKGVAFHGVLVELLHGDDVIAVEERHRVAELIRAGIASGAVRPLDTILYPRDRVEDAFRFMSSGKHIGKIVLEVQPEKSLETAEASTPLFVEATARTWFYGHKSYVITGGLGGFGLELADWMVNRGCRKLLLTTHSGVRTGYQRLCLHRFQKAGANVIVRKIDAAEEEGALKVLEEAAAMGPIGGIFILAVLLRDGLLENQTAEAFETVMKIKIDGTKYLDKLSRKMCPELDHFVAFSSLAAGIGNVGQTNYGYANSAMECICELRAAQGLPDHHAAANQTAEAFETVMKIKIDGTKYLDKLSRKMCPELDHFVAFSSLAAGIGNVGQTNYGYANSAMECICELRAAQGLPGLAIQWGPIADVGVFHEKMGDDATISGSVPQRISSCIALMDQFLNQTHPIVSSCAKAHFSDDADNHKPGLLEVVARILGVKDPSRVNQATLLNELGMDSLMAVEVRQAIERYVGLTLSMKEIRQLTIEGLRILSEGSTARDQA